MMRSSTKRHGKEVAAYSCGNRRGYCKMFAAMLLVCGGLSMSSAYVLPTNLAAVGKFSPRIANRLRSELPALNAMKMGVDAAEPTKSSAEPELINM
jgi:hypothetical protein